MLRVFLIMLASFGMTAFASPDPFAETDWSLVGITCKSGKPDLPDGVVVVWVQSFHKNSGYRLYENLSMDGSLYCDNILHGSYEVKSATQVAVTTNSSPNKKMCEVNPFGTFLWNYEFKDQGKTLVLSGTDSATQGNCGAGDQVIFTFRSLNP